MPDLMPYIKPSSQYLLSILIIAMSLSMLSGYDWIQHIVPNLEVGSGVSFLAVVVITLKGFFIYH